MCCCCCCHNWKQIRQCPPPSKERGKKRTPWYFCCNRDTYFVFNLQITPFWSDQIEDFLKNKEPFCLLQRSWSDQDVYFLQHSCARSWMFTAFLNKIFRLLDSLNFILLSCIGKLLWKHFVIFHCRNTDACQKYQGRKCGIIRDWRTGPAEVFYFLWMQLV